MIHGLLTFGTEDRKVHGLITGFPSSQQFALDLFLFL